MKITMLCGMPASGKSFMGEALARKEDNCEFIDDISVDPSLIKRFKKLLSDDFGHVVIADVFLCEEKHRTAAEKLIKKLNPTAEIEWIYFENAPDKCRKNVAHRADGRAVEGSIKRFAKSYTIPYGVTPIKIWQPEIEV